MGQRSRDELAAVLARHSMSADTAGRAEVERLGLTDEPMLSSSRDAPRFHILLRGRDGFPVADGWGDTIREAFLQGLAEALEPSRGT